MRILRPFQVEAGTKALASLASTGSALLVMATGLGKTITAVYVAEQRLPLGRVLFVVHREEIVNQAAAAFAAETMMSVGIEHADRRVSPTLPDVVVASTQTLAVHARRERFGRDAFGTVIVDEVHHYSKAAPMFASVVDYFAAPKLGLTATPERGDGAPLIIGPITFRYGMRQGMRGGYLVDLRRAIELIPGFEQARVRIRAGDYDAAELEAELIKAPAVAAVADAILRRAGERPTIAFCAGILHSKAIATALDARRPGCATFASGEERAGVGELLAGRVKVLANADLTVEGFDHPPVACVALVRPTKSVGRATQQIGRGTRLSPETGKSDCLIIEFIGGDSSEQVSTVDVVGADMPQRVREAAERILDQRPSLSVLDALDQAAARAGGVAMVPARKVRAVVDPMRLILGLDGMIMEPPRAGAAPATAEQVRLLEQAGLRVAGLDVRQAAILLAGIRWRRGRGRSTPAQALDLYRYGYDLECTATEATRRLAQMGVAAA